MISTKDLSGLPNAERLKNFCKGLAALDIIMVEEEWSFIRHYTCNPAWRKGKEAFFATDGSDQSMIAIDQGKQVFGCVLAVHGIAVPGDAVFRPDAEDVYKRQDSYLFSHSVVGISVSSC